MAPTRARIIEEDAMRTGTPSWVVDARRVPEAGLLLAPTASAAGRAAAIPTAAGAVRHALEDRDSGEAR